MPEGMEREFDRQRAERKRLQEMDQRKRLANEAAIRLVLDEFYPAGVADELIERICQIQNRLIKETVRNEKIIREMHDGIHLVAEGAAQRWLDGFHECADQVRGYAAELGLAPVVVDSLLRNDARTKETSREVKDEAATRQVEWKRS